MVDSASEQTPAHDFDFLFSDWQIGNERLFSRLTGSTDWERFEARASCRPVLGGLGNVDDFQPEDWPGHTGFEGGAWRLFNPQTGLWSIYWFDNTACSLYPPVHGSFTNGVGEFTGTDEQDGTSVLVRYRWSGMTETSARWEQAFSTDSGASWETNWIMSFTRPRP